MTTNTSRPSSNDDEGEEQEEASPSMSRCAEDNISNSEGQLLLLLVNNNKSHDYEEEEEVYKRNQMHSTAMLLHQDNNWHKSCVSRNDYDDEDEKKSHRCMWMLTAGLAFIGFCNLMLNLAIIVVLRVSQGMEALEVISNDNLVKFYGNTDLDRVCLQRGIFEGFGDEPIELIGDTGGVNIQVSNRRHGMAWSNLQVLKNGTSVSRVRSFQVKDPRSGSPIFSTDFPNFVLPKGVKHIQVDNTQTHRIAAPKKKDLFIRSDQKIYLHGAEGTSLDSKNIAWTAFKDIFLRSREGNVVIDAKDGIYLPKIPIVTSTHKSNDMQGQYKVCVCMPNGKLFLVSTHGSNAKVNCARMSRSMEKNPCTSE